MRTRKEYLDRLQRRADHLRGRIAAAEADGQNLNWDKAEMSALLWAIEEIRSQGERILASPVRVGNTIFRPGVAWETVIGRAEREFSYRQEPHPIEGEANA
jgi:hypothetical protein